MDFLRKWDNWCGQEDLAAEFLRNLGACQEGGATVAECRLAASSIVLGDNASWFSEWKAIADRSRDRAHTALRQGHLITARSNWLRAMNYYLTAAFPLDELEPTYQAAIAEMRSCAQQWLRSRRPSGEVVTVHSGSNRMEGYFLPASDSNEAAPVIVCVGEADQRKEQYLYKYERYAAQRGISLLAMDFFDVGAPERLSPVAQDPESAIGGVMDYLTSRDDVCADRIGILADAWGSSFVARAVGRDGRFAAAVCDGGIWDLQESAFLHRATMEGESVERLRSNVARALRCPVLITVGEEGWLAPERVASLVSRLRLDHPDIALKIFSREESAATQGHADNPTIASEYIFDWIATQLQAVEGI
jgi:dienelactone hydrolase